MAGAWGAGGCKPRLPGTPTVPGTPVPVVARAPAGVAFREVAEEAGLRYSWGPRNRSPLTNLDTFGAGCGFADFDRDGYLDVVAVGEPGIRIFRGSAEGRFTEGTDPLLSALRGRWIGLAVADYDGDAWPDLLVTGFPHLRLLRNDGGKRFTDSTSAAGLNPHNWGRWGSSAGFADLDGDGDLDLVVMNYVQFGPDVRKLCELAPGVVSGCPPTEYDPEYTRVYRYDAGRFSDVTVKAGCNTTHGKGLALAFCDYDDDGRVDFYLGNDGTPSDLLHNLGGFRFRNVGIETGAAFGSSGQPTAAMGADWGDFDGDGKFDFAASAFSDEEYSLMRQENGLFVALNGEVELGLPTYKPLGFGTKFLDADNDTRLDLHFVNGHVYDTVKLIDPLNEYRQPMMLFMHRPDGKLEDVAAKAGPEFAAPLVGRGSAVGDYDNDGRQDLLVVDLEGRLRLYRNETPGSNHWLRIELRGSQPKNRLAYGARVTVKIGKGTAQRVLPRDVSPASSYLSSSDPRVHFGLGSSTTVEAVRVRWPDGRTQEARGVAADQGLLWVEGAEPRVVTATR